MYKLIAMLTAVAVPTLAASPALAAQEASAVDGLRVGGATVAVTQVAPAGGDRSGTVWHQSAALGDDGAQIAAWASVGVEQTPVVLVAEAAPEREAARAPPVRWASRPALRFLLAGSLAFTARGETALLPRAESRSR